MTKVIIIGEEEDNRPSLKPIVFEGILRVQKDINSSVIDKPKDFNFIELISKGYSSGRTTDRFDLMFAYNKNRAEGCLVIGQWNDGVVEE